MRERDRHAVGSQLEQIDVLPGEVAALQRADVEHADRPAVDDERDADHAGDPLAADQRIEDVGVLDVGEHDGPQLGGDPSGEALADGDVEALLQLLLDPQRGVGDELVPLLVEEQDRAGVGVEERSDAVEQVVGSVRPGVRERSVGHSLQAMEPLPESPHGRRMSNGSRV